MRPEVLKTVTAALAAAGYVVAPRNEQTSAEVAAIAGRGVTDPKSLTEAEIKSVCASALTQTPAKAE
jgi:hypothetical protein